MRAFFILCFALALTGCAAHVLAESDAQAAQRLRSEIAKLIGEANCRNIVNCRILGLGFRPCGGFEEYVAYSIWETKREDLEIKAMSYNFLREELVAAGQQMGTCEVLPEPRAACINSRCVTRPAEN